MAQRHKGGSTGNVLSSSIFDAFGVRQSTPSTTDPFGYGAQWGYYTDHAETGLILLTHRYYNPNGGRLLSRDPIGYAGGINLYRYAGNNPINRADPLGLLSPGDVLGEIGVAMSWAEAIDCPSFATIGSFTACRSPSASMPVRLTPSCHGGKLS